MPSGRSYVAAPYSYQDSSFTSNSFDIREGSVRLGSMFVDRPAPTPRKVSRVEQTLWEQPTPKTTPGTTPIQLSGISQIFQQNQDEEDSGDSSSTVKESPETVDALQVVETPQTALPTVLETEDDVQAVLHADMERLDERTPLLVRKYGIDAPLQDRKSVV